MKIDLTALPTPAPIKKPSVRRTDRLSFSEIPKSFEFLRQSRIDVKQRYHAGQTFGMPGAGGFP
jgi:hypothetical protein